MNYNEARILLHYEATFLNPDAVLTDEFRDRIADLERRADREEDIDSHGVFIEQEEKYISEFDG